MQRYAITDGEAGKQRDGGVRLVRQVAGWVAAGVEWVQVREKPLPAPELTALVGRLAELTRGSQTRLLVNGLAARLAREQGAAGVHLPGGAGRAEVRLAATLAGIVTVSCHTLGELEAARDGGAAAALWAPVFEKVVGNHEVARGTGLIALRGACAAAEQLPVFALGGVTAANAGECLDAGAAGVAGIRLFSSDDWWTLT